MEDIREKILRWQIKAEALFKEGKRVFIKDSNETYFAADILIVGESKISFKPFKGNNCNETVTRYWADILKFKEYREEIK